MPPIAPSSQSASAPTRSSMQHPARRHPHQDCRRVVASRGMTPQGTLVAIAKGSEKARRQGSLMKENHGRQIIAFGRAFGESYWTFRKYKTSVSAGCAEFSVSGFLVTLRPRMRMPSLSHSSFSRTTVATATLVGFRNANTSSRLKAAAAAMAAGSKVTAGQGYGFTATSTLAGRSPAPSERPSIALHEHRFKVKIQIGIQIRILQPV